MFEFMSEMQVNIACYVRFLTFLKKNLKYTAIRKGFGSIINKGG